jgi:hypothetical protein
MAPFGWQNCYADVAASQHDKTIRPYLDDVIIPALNSLDRRIEDLDQFEEPWVVFERRDVDLWRPVSPMALPVADVRAARCRCPKLVIRKAPGFWLDRVVRGRTAVSCSTKKPDNRFKQTIRELKA